MAKGKEIPVHHMDDKFSGVYVAPLTGHKPSGAAYEISQPHRHDYYYCVLLDEGHMELEVDFAALQLTSRSLYLSYPGQVHRIVSTHVERGWFLAVDPAVLDEPLRDILDQSLAEVILLPLAPAQAAGFFSLIEQLYAVYQQPDQIFCQPIMQALALAFGYQVAAAYSSAEKLELSTHSARSVDIARKFKQLLRQHYKMLHKPADFAARLHLTVSHLNDTVRAVTGFPVTYLIQQELMREAQRLLSHSDLAVNQIAYALGFEDAQYFNRLFRKIVGVAPGAFRGKSAPTVEAGTNQPTTNQ